MFKFDKKAPISYSKIMLLKFKRADEKGKRDCARSVYGLCKIRHSRETKENYRKEVERYIEKFLRVIH